MNNPGGTVKPVLSDHACAKKKVVFEKRWSVKMHCKATIGTRSE